MTRRGAAALGIGLALTAAACTGSRPGPDFQLGGGPGALTAFSSCDALLDYIKANAPRQQDRAGFAEDQVTAAEGAASSSADRLSAPATTTTVAAAGSSKRAALAEAGDDSGFSTTNIQEKDVDEPDVVKTDGRRLVTLTGTRLNIVDVTSTPKVVGDYDLAKDDFFPSELLVQGDRVVVFSNGGGRVPMPGQRWASSGDVAGMSEPHWSVDNGFVVLDIADPAKPKRVATMTFEGRYVSARLANGVVRLVVHSQPKRPGVYDGAAYEDAVQHSTIEDWLPTYTLDRPGQAPKTAPIAPCAQVLRGEEFTGMSTVSVFSVDPKNPEPADPACVLGAGETVYASLDSLVVATSSWQAAPRPLRPGMAPTASTVSSPTTDIHQFSIKGDGAAKYEASGRVAGTVLNQFAFSEHEGRLRLATTVWGPMGTDNVLRVMERQESRLVEIGTLAGLGHEMESIHSVRFVGDRAYIVTFRRTDPLYVINLSDPRRPVKEGELEVPGFSSYLHPLSETKLLGVGQAPSESGGQGLQVSLFDVADPARPTRIDNKVFPNAYSLAQNDHHAFTWWPKTGQLFLPFSEYDYSGTGYVGVLVMEVEPSKGFGAVSRLQHAALTKATQLNAYRNVVVGSRLLSVADYGLLTTGLPGLEPQSWLAW